MQPDRKKTLGYALLQAALVVLGVVLALAGNEWREAAANRDKARVATASLIEELQANRAATQQALEYHQGLMEKILASSEAGESLDARAFPRGFVSPAQLSRTAWTSAAQVGVLNHIPYSQVLDISRVYSSQDRYDDQARSIGLVFYGEIVRDGINAIPRNASNLAAVVSMFIHREQELLALYDEKLAAMAAAD